MWRIKLEIQFTQELKTLISKETLSKRLVLANYEPTIFGTSSKLKVADFTFNTETEARKAFDAVKALMVAKSLVGRIIIHNCSHSEGEQATMSCREEQGFEEYFNGTEI